MIDESSDSRQHASGRREDQVDDPFWCAPLGQDVDERATAHVVHAAVLGQERHAMPCFELFGFTRITYQTTYAMACTEQGAARA